MAIAYQSIKTSGWSTTITDQTVDKPIDLAVGDLMIAIVYWRVQSDMFANFPAGFTKIRYNADSETGGGITTAYKVATSTDVSATNYTFGGFSTNGYDHFCSIIRITGSSLGGGFTSNGNFIVNASSPSIDCGVTPTNYGSSTLLLLLIGTDANDTINQAIATSNPSWTEIQDSKGSSNSLSICWSSRPEFTVTGNVSCSSTAGTNKDWVAQLISIPPPYVITDTISMSDDEKSNTTILRSETITMSESVDTSYNIWTNETKPTDTWVNETK